MTILAIDSSALPLSAALLRDDVLIAEYTICLKLTHSETLMPVVDDVIKRTGTGLDEIDAFAVAGGPGSFTGLRIGSATIKGLADALNKPVVSVPTLKAMAYNIMSFDTLIVPMLDARRRNVYTGIFEQDSGELKTVLDQSIISVDLLLEKIAGLRKRTVFLGDGAVKYKDEIDEKLDTEHFFAPPHLNMQRGSAVAALGMIMYKNGEFTDAGGHKPDYLKAAQAEQEKKEAEKAGKLKELAAGGHSLYV